MPDNGILSSLLNAFPRHRIAPRPQLLDDLNVAERARADGVNNLPSADDQAPNTVQAEVVDRCRSEIERLRRAALEDLARRVDVLSGLELSPAEVDFDTLVEDARRKTEQAIAGSRDALVAAKDQVDAQGRELRAYIDRHRLSRGAWYPESPLLPLGFFALVLAIETVANATFFAGTNPLGMLGGAFTAIVVSALNVMPGFVAGFLALRHAFHINRWHRAAGLLGTMSWLVWLVGFNLFVAHVRFGLGIDPTRAPGVALDRLMADPWAFTTNFDAVVLFAAGLLAGSFAAIDGFALWDDRYPGYGAVDRRYRAALKVRDDEKRRVGHAVTAVVEGAVGVIERRLGRINRQVVEAYGVVRDGLMAFQRAAQGAEEASELCVRTLRLYRETNSLVRSTPAPAYFTLYPALDHAFGDLERKLLERREIIAALGEAKLIEANAAKERLRAIARAADGAVEALLESIFDHSRVTAAGSSLVTIDQGQDNA